MEFSQESIKDIFIHFPGLVGIFDSISEHFIWGNENWAKQYAPSDRIVPETINTIAERYIHHDDQPTFLNFYHQHDLHYKYPLKNHLYIGHHFLY